MRHFDRLAYAPRCSAVAIKLPMKVTMSRVLRLVMSSGTSQMVAPIFRAIEMASFALAMSKTAKITRYYSISSLQTLAPAMHCKRETSYSAPNRFYKTPTDSTLLAANS